MEGLYGESLYEGYFRFDSWISDTIDPDGLKTEKQFVLYLSVNWTIICWIKGDSRIRSISLITLITLFLFVSRFDQPYLYFLRINVDEILAQRQCKWKIGTFYYVIKRTMGSSISNIWTEKASTWNFSAKKNQTFEGASFLSLNFDKL